MFSPTAFFIALRYAKTRQKNSFVAFINGFSVAGITLGLMALITVISIMNGFEAQLKQRILGVVPHLLVSIEMPLEGIAEQPNVRAVMPYEEVEAVVQSQQALRGVMLQGVSPEHMQKHSIVAEHILLGQFNLNAGQYGAVVGRSLANQLALRVGDRMRVLIAGKTIYTPFGRVPSQRLVTVTGIFDLASQVDDTVVYMHWQDVKSLKRRGGEKAQQWRIFLDDAFAFAQLAQVISTAGFENVSWRQRQGTLFDAVKMEKNLMFIMLLLIITVAAFNIVSALVMVVSEKQSDIAILQTQGMQPGQVLNIFLINGVLNGLKGAVLGSILGALAIVSINPMLAFFDVGLVLSVNGQAVPIDVDYGQIMIVIGLSLLLCLLASLYPALRAMRTLPAETLHNN